MATSGGPRSLTSAGLDPFLFWKSSGFRGISEGLTLRRKARASGRLCPTIPVPDVSVHSGGPVFLRWRSSRGSAHCVLRGAAREASWELSWESVASRGGRVPFWAQMCRIRDGLTWGRLRRIPDPCRLRWGRKGIARFAALAHTGLRPRHQREGLEGPAKFRMNWPFTRKKTGALVKV